jgi:hypothetical protein
MIDYRLSRFLLPMAYYVLCHYCPYRRRANNWSAVPLRQRTSVSPIVEALKHLKSQGHAHPTQSTSIHIELMNRTL